MYGSNTTATLRRRYQVSNSSFGTHSSNKSSGSLFCILAASLICKEVALLVTSNLLQVRFKFDASNFAMTSQNQTCCKLTCYLGTLQELRNRITDACDSVSPAMLYNVQREVQSRVQMCIVAEGYHFEHDR
ncbi:hypothetical protein AVEN_154945-1 [Araneus ventricosus]|uniref:Uncharacterized protein n=1 Tax=Araneus ventricosus TaxID=182803 RepID=A0A4Y2A780_ARAVE|nr:hypothetical protein AVEN_154945-1 [Araneus ventricosus]